MPPKNKYSREQIVEAAFDIAVEEGIDGITIRKVADRLGSSIAPIYVNFKDVHELKKAIITKVVALSHQMIQEQNSGSPFKDIGIASLKMAEQYPKLYNDFAMKPNEYIKDYNNEMGNELVGLMKQDEHLADFTDEELMKVLFKMKVFQTGLTMMVSNQLVPEEMGMDQMIAMLDDVAIDVIMATQLRKDKNK